MLPFLLNDVPGTCLVQNLSQIGIEYIEYYLMQTKDCGLVLDPNSDVCKVYAYPDADFSGIYGHEKPTDDACVKSRTVIIIVFADSTVLCISKLHTETALLTIEA